MTARRTLVWLPLLLAALLIGAVRWMDRPEAPLPRAVPTALGPAHVVVVPGLHDGEDSLFGRVHFDTRLIEIRAGLHPVTARQALEHERCHLALWDASVQVPDLALEERICDAWGTARVRER